MANYFFDSSALVKSYVVETGTNWVVTILDNDQNRIHISLLAEVEIVAALTVDTASVILISSNWTKHVTK